MFHHLLKPVKKFRRSYLPGIVTASSDDDPSSISTYAAAGATGGLAQLWLVLLSTPLLIVIHSLAARIGDVAKKGLISLIKENFGRKTAAFCLITVVAANLFTLVADIIGMAAGLQLLTGRNYIYFIVPLIILIWYVVVFDNYKHIAKYFFWFSGILLAYFFAAILAKPDWLRILEAAFIPRVDFNVNYIAAGIALLGTAFSPYTFFWQTKEEIEEKHTSKNISQSKAGVMLGFIYSNLISFFIIVAAASAAGNLTVSLNSLTIKEIAASLAPLAGGWAAKLFGLGLLGSGILAIPVLATSSAYAVAEFFSWPDGLNKKPGKAKGFYGVITFGFLICLAALFLKLQPLKIMIYSQIFVGILTPILIYFILKIARSRKIMQGYRCHWLSYAAGWLAIAILSAGDGFLIYYLTI